MAPVTHHTLARLNQPDASLARPAAPIDDFRPLDKYARGFADEPLRVPWLATISAGYTGKDRDNNPIPRASRKEDPEWIHMTPEDVERAPGLHAGLEAAGFRWLDIAVPFDDPRLFLQQRFEKRSASRLEAYGDEREITEIVLRDTGKRDRNNKPIQTAEHVTHLAGSIDYDRIVQDRDCKVSVSFFFVLARWEGRQPRIYFPDGLGVYRLRFTSRHSLREILATLRQLSSLTGGRLAGLPLRLTLDFREVADPTGTRRTICVWKPRFMPPQQLELTPALWQNLARDALAEGQMLRLPAPTPETLEDAAEVVDIDLDQPSTTAIEALESGPPCDPAFYRRAFFARIKGTSLDSDEARAGFIEGVSGGRTDSLTKFLATATEAQAAAMLAAAGQIVGREQTADTARRYDEIFGKDDDTAVVEPPGEHTATRDATTSPSSSAGSSQGPSRSDLWQRNRELCEIARQIGVSGVPVLNNRSTEDQLATANAELEERIRLRNAELDAQAVRQEAF